MRVENTTTHVIQYLISTNEVINMGPGTRKKNRRMDAITEVASKVTLVASFSSMLWSSILIPFRPARGGPER